MSARDALVAKFFAISLASALLRLRTCWLAPTELPILPRPSIAASQNQNQPSNLPGSLRDVEKSSSPLRTRLNPRIRSRAMKNVKSSTTLLRVGISDASEAVMGEIDVLLSIASLAPSGLLNRVRRHLTSSASIATSGLR